MCHHLVKAMVVYVFRLTLRGFSGLPVCAFRGAAFVLNTDLLPTDVKPMLESVFPPLEHSCDLRCQAFVHTYIHTDKHTDTRTLCAVWLCLPCVAGFEFLRTRSVSVSVCSRKKPQQKCILSIDTCLRLLTSLKQGSLTQSDGPNCVIRTYMK